jgi:uncharacterized membrane protein YqiK
VGDISMPIDVFFIIMIIIVILGIVLAIWYHKQTYKEIREKYKKDMDELFGKDK